MHDQSDEGNCPQFPFVGDRGEILHLMGLESHHELPVTDVAVGDRIEKVQFAVLMERRKFLFPQGYAAAFVERWLRE